MSLFPDMLRVDCEFGDDLIAHYQRKDGDYLVVRVELEDEHPAMQDVVADGIIDPEQAEFISYVHLSDARDMDGEPFKAPW